MAWKNILEIVAETASLPDPVTVSLSAAGFSEPALVISDPYIQTDGYPADEFLGLTNSACSAGAGDLIFTIHGLEEYFGASVNVRATMDGYIDTGSYIARVETFDSGSCPAAIDEVSDSPDLTLAATVLATTFTDPASVGFRINPDSGGTSSGRVRFLVEVEDWPLEGLFWTDLQGCEQS